MKRERQSEPAGNKRRRREAPTASAERYASPRLSLAAWREQHLYSALSSLGRLWQRRGATLLTVLVMALALALPLLLHLGVRNLEHFGGMLREARELSVFISPASEQTRIAALAAELGATPGVAAIATKGPEEGLAELRQLPGFAEAIELLQSNPLPTVLLVTPAVDASPEEIHALARVIQESDGVDFVQYDLAWRERLSRALAVAERMVLVVATLFGLGVLLVVGNTIRLDVLSRSEEIAVVQLMGGSDGFVRRPFLYAGCWYGLFASVLALLGSAVAQFALTAPVAALAASYGSDFAVRGLALEAVGATFAAGIVLGWLGAWAACGRHLSHGRPR